LIDSLSFDALLESSTMHDFLCAEVSDKFVSPKGIRLLKRMGLEEKSLGLLVSKFDCLKKILKADDDALMGVFGSMEDVEIFKSSLNELKQNILLQKDF
jgi:DNA integrity scanning protein DisA with diadenylate cyclase activity